MILLIDNYDSFVYNLARYFEELGRETSVVRNDAVSIADLESSIRRGEGPEAIVLSPGPCDPYRAGVSIDVVRALGARVPVLGVCLGHQAIGAAYGARIVRARPVHGRTSAVHHVASGLFEGLPSPFPAARYHSLIIERETLPQELEVTAATGDGIILAVRHREQPVIGIQFHPESVLTEHGHRILANFLAMLPARAPLAGSISS